jgi:hypothetical protein
MGSSYFPRINTSGSYSVTGPTGPTGERGETGPTGYGATGNTGNSVSGITLVSNKLRTTFSDGSTYDTQNNFKGITGETYLSLGFTFGSGLSLFAGRCGAGGTFNFWTIKGRTSASGRAEISVGISGNNILLNYINSSSAFVGYSGGTFVSLPKTKYGSSSIFATKNVFEKARGMGFTGSTFPSGITCNYIAGGTLSYVDSEGYVGYTACKILYIDPDCVGHNTTDVQIRNKVFVADMKNNISRVILGNSSHPSIASSITLIIQNALNGPTAIGQGEKRFKLASLTGGILWPFDLEPCFCGSTSTNVYHLFSIGGYTWYGSVGSVTDPSKFFDCPNGKIIEGLTEGFGACCYDDGSAGGTCTYTTSRQCASIGATSFWHNSVICGSSPCAKTGGCCMNFTSKGSENSYLCLNGITCINCIRGMVYDSNGDTYNAETFTYLGNGVTCTNSNCSGVSDA